MNGGELLLNAIELKAHTAYSESELIELIRNANPSFSDIKIKWALFELEKSNKITRIGTKKYITNGKRYSYVLSESAQRIDSFLSNDYPDLDYIIWESSQLNEWMNLLLAKRIIFVEVESDLKDYAFSFLQEKFCDSKMILLSPDFKILSRYIDNSPVAVRSLFSKSPKSRDGHRISIEKLLVDVFSDRLLKSLIGTKDREEIANGITRSYAINETKTLAYAKRRKCDEEIRALFKCCQ